MFLFHVVQFQEIADGIISVVDFLYSPAVFQAELKTDIISGPSLHLKADNRNVTGIVRLKVG